jgi:hypothetical protein
MEMREGGEREREEGAGKWRLYHHGCPELDWIQAYRVRVWKVSAKHGKVEAFGRERSGFGMEGSSKHGKSRAREIGMRSVGRCIRRIIR